MRDIRIGMIGVGGFGAARRELMRRAGGFRIVRCADRDPRHLADACREENAQAADSAHDLVTDPAIEAVVVSTGASSHAELVELALRAGKPVFVEKPLCCSLSEITRLRDVASRTGGIVGVGHHQNACDPFVMLVRRLQEDGSLGDIAAYEKNSSHSGGFQIQADDWRSAPENNPGGCCSSAACTRSIRSMRCSAR